MKANNFFKIFLLLAISFTFASVMTAQDNKPLGAQADGQKPTATPDPRANALGQLGLSPEQRQEIRRINIERKPRMEEAQRRLREANRALDEAIYADQVNEADVQMRLKEHHAAQAEVARIRFTNELAVRKVLTPEQLQRFRMARQNFEQALEQERNKNQNKANGQNQKKADGLTPRQERRQLIRQGQFPQRPNSNPNKVRPNANPNKVPQKP